jgi:hypothetical protein
VACLRGSNPRLADYEKQLVCGTRLASNDAWRPGNTFRRALAVGLQPLRHTGACDEAVRLVRRNILQQVLVEALG